MNTHPLDISAFPPHQPINPRLYGVLYARPHGLLTSHLAAWQSATAPTPSRTDSRRSLSGSPRALPSTRARTLETVNTVPPCARGILDLARTKMLATFQTRHLCDVVLMTSYLYLLFIQSTSKFVHMCSCCQVFLRSPALSFGDGIFSDPDSCSCCASFIGSPPRLVCCIPIDGDRKGGRRDIRGKASGDDGTRESYKTERARGSLNASGCHACSPPVLKSTSHFNLQYP
jgi:hypothetical protein